MADRPEGMDEWVTEIESMAALLMDALKGTRLALAAIERSHLDGCPVDAGVRQVVKNAIADADAALDGGRSEHLDRLLAFQLVLQALPADDINGLALEEYADYVEKCGAPIFAERLRRYARIVRAWRIPA